MQAVGQAVRHRLGWHPQGYKRSPRSVDVMEATRTLRDRSILENALRDILARSGLEKEYNALADWTKRVRTGCGVALLA